jgi:hypothetical protein
MGFHSSSSSATSSISDFRTTLWNKLWSIDGVIFVGIMIIFVYGAYKSRGMSVTPHPAAGGGAAAEACTPRIQHNYPDFLAAINDTERISLKHYKLAPARINKSEEKCRVIFEKIFKRAFYSVRPDWLQNPATGQNLELDGFCEHITTPIGEGVAFEYDGAQHAKFNKFFHDDNVDKFKYQVVKDEWKSAVCRKRGIVLIRIPHYVSSEDLEEYIVDRLKANGLGHYVSG